MTGENIPGETFEHTSDDDELAADLYERHVNPDGSSSRNRPVLVSDEAAKQMGKFIRFTLEQRDALAKARMEREDPDTEVL
jgi:hypothetical protein